jgi:hypothetical protein
MPISLSKEHRKLLENTTGQARALAEMASKAALENLAVHEKEYRAHMSDKQRGLRNRLRSRARALGDVRDAKGEQSIRHLTELAAYEHWHRLLFTRFLTENNLLITDEENGSVPITLDECEELALELGARDGFDLACRFASRILPGVFRRDDPVLDLPIALNDQVAMRNLLNALPTECFQADDALGWTYQFWQAQRKKEVNDSGKKIGADELSPVTQLFTEDYMVEFLLHNTLGAWWAGKLGPIQADTEEEARLRAGLEAREGVPAIAWSYLRFVQDETTKLWSPAAGTFEGWPRDAKSVTLLDPCMGSGHFLVFALPLLVRLRMEDEQLTPKSAAVAVLKDNIHGLELDERCTQIAAFNVALTAWKLAGYQTLPQLHLACSGLAPSATQAEWIALAGANERLKNGMARLYRLFKDAPVIGSLINPRATESTLLESDFRELQPLLENALAQEAKDDTLHEMAVTAQGLAKASEILAEKFTLVATNVPYLGFGKQNETLQDFCSKTHSDAKADLATCFLERCIDACSPNGVTACVTPQNWLFLNDYKNFRRKLLNQSQWLFALRLGPGAFETISGEVVKASLVAIKNCIPVKRKAFFASDTSSMAAISEKIHALKLGDFNCLFQEDQLKNPNWVVTSESLTHGKLLQTFATGFEGAKTVDIERFRHLFWELSCVQERLWWFHNSSPTGEGLISGCHYVSANRSDGSVFQKNIEVYERDGKKVVAWLCGSPCWNKMGVSVAWMNNLPASLYIGTVFDNSAAVILPKSDEFLPAIYCFISSGDYTREVRKINQKIQVAAGTLDQVPFDFSHWQKVAAEKFPHGLPKPFSNDPTQWLFNGHPKDSDQPLHVAVARLLGYQWPRQTGSSFPDCPALGPDGLEGLADGNGIVCLPPVNHEQPAANRLRSLLATALGSFDEASLLAAAGLKGSKSKTLEVWLRDEFFEQHAKLFHDRPFIWHLWDGRPDGFHVLVNYHKLDHATLQKLTYSYLGDWIQDQARDAKENKPGAAERLGAAQELQKKLAAILEGEAPLDIFVRWKPLKDQAEGWNPDLNDGVRQNIRPFLLAGDVGKRGTGLFRAIPLKLKDSDRGNEPQRPKEEYPWFWCEEEPGTDPAGGDAFVGTRWNNVHLTLAKKKGAKA